MNKRSVIIVLHLCLIPIFCGAQAKISKVEKAALRRFEAMEQRDTVALQDLLSDDLLYIHSNALTENKQVFIASVASGKIRYEKMQQEEQQIHRYGRMAILNGIVHVNGSLNATPFEVRLRYTSVYRRSMGKWKLMRWQSTKIP
jgi:ketosteroid isomerase-like protein